ncbi:arylsulfotransferase family protein [Haloactinopolyspora alba]|nr:arylsulfotransferase family protein [Haloactinopolyspora alba]
MSYERITRAVALSGAALMLTATACQSGEEPSSARPSETPTPGAGWEFTTHPNLTPPLVDVSQTRAPATEAPARPADEDLFMVAPKGEESPMTALMIADSEGDPVWVHPVEGNSYNFRTQEYNGEQVLTWWRGDNSTQGHGKGEFVIMNNSYEVITTVTTTGTARADFHEITITDDGTALLASYPTVGGQDLTEFDGPKDGYVLDGVIQEVDIATGEVLFEWSALDHVDLSETENSMEDRDEQDGSEEKPFDFFHINSVTEDGDSLLVSARNTHAIYRIDRETGELDWTLGGNASDFKMTGDSYFAWQHDAQRQEDGTITLFDNQSSPPIGDQSRGLRLDVDTENMTASVVTEYLPPDGRLAASQGNLQVRDNGNVVIGWGAEPFYSEYTAEGELLYDAKLSGGDNYRAYRLPWEGDPTRPPRLEVEDRMAYVSWNGATEVASWRFLGGPDAEDATEVATVPREGFETTMPVPDQPYVAAEALDADGNVLDTVSVQTDSDS